ncbi:unnamed protein product [Calypogeia fissa]
MVACLAADCFILPTARPAPGGRCCGPPARVPDPLEVSLMARILPKWCGIHAVTQMATGDGPMNQNPTGTTTSGPGYPHPIQAGQPEGRAFTRESIKIGVENRSVRSARLRHLPARLNHFRQVYSIVCRSAGAHEKEIDDARACFLGNKVTSVIMVSGTRNPNIGYYAEPNCPTAPLQTPDFRVQTASIPSHTDGRPRPQTDPKVSCDANSRAWGRPSAGVWVCGTPF